ncbi:uncharacterized protein LOC143028078 [Oratosquilla oratoria]|uniref:uncharacterized protein LOC143028078 n=1 Tax=Oratosquilla oratoria TaxID=337810 RepID=UPI003F75D293
MTNSFSNEPLGATNLIQHYIPLRENLKPRYDPAYKMPHNNIVFTTLDLMSGYFQISLGSESRPPGSFQYPYRTISLQTTSHESRLVSPPSVFIRLMETVLADIIDHSVFMYFNDVIIALKSVNEHLLLTMSSHV